MQILFLIPFSRFIFFTYTIKKLYTKKIRIFLSFSLRVKLIMCQDRQNVALFLRCFWPSHIFSNTEFIQNNFFISCWSVSTKKNAIMCVKNTIKNMRHLYRFVQNVCLFVVIIHVTYIVHDYTQHFIVHKK